MKKPTKGYIISFKRERLRIAIEEFVEEHREDYEAFMAAAMEFGEHIKNGGDPYGKIGED